MLVTAWIYSTPGHLHNEEVVARAIEKYGRDKWIIVDKIGVDLSKGFKFVQTEEGLRGQLEESLARLKTDYIDLLVLNRPDPSIPIEDTMAVLKGFVTEGKARYIGLSEATPDEIRRAHAVHPISAVEQEYSLQTRDIETGGMVPVLNELGIGVLAYSPLGRGMLGAPIRSRADLLPGDYRLHSPRFSEENLAKNAAKADKLAEIAAGKGATPAQLALAWLIHKSTSIKGGVVPIPGTTNAGRLEENLKASSVALSDADVALIETNVPEAEGERYPGMHGTWNKRASASAPVSTTGGAGSAAAAATTPSGSS